MAPGLRARFCWRHPDDCLRPRVPSTVVGAASDRGARDLVARASVAPLPRRPVVNRGRVARLVSGIGVAAVMGATVAAVEVLPAPVLASRSPAVLTVPPSITTLVCPGPARTRDRRLGRRTRP